MGSIVLVYNIKLSIVKFKIFATQKAKEIKGLIIWIRNDTKSGEAEDIRYTLLKNESSAPS